MIPATETRQWPLALRILRGRGQSGNAAKATGHKLYNSGYALVVNTAGTTAIGVAYWAVAAHLYGRQALGRSSAMISALILVSSVAQLNLNNTLPRFLPLAGRRSGRLIRYCYGASSLTGLMVGLGFVILMPHLSAQWRFLSQTPLVAPAFVIATVVWGIFALEDCALTGLRRAVVVPVENTVYGALKLLILLGLASLFPATGIFFSWLLPLFLIVPAVNWLIFGRYLRTDEWATPVATVRPREVVRFTGVDYIGSLLGQFYSNMLPLIVLTTLGAAANGIFYVAWTITFGLSLVATNFATSMLVEGTSAPHRLAELTRGVLARCALIIAPCVGLLIVAAHPILTIYGSQYADRATGLLGLLAIAVLPRTLVLVAFSLDRLAGRVGRATLTNLILTILVLGGSWLMLTRIGIDGVALAWGGGNLVIAVLRLPTIIGAARGVRGGEDNQVASNSLPAREPSISALLARPTMSRLGRGRPPGRHRSAKRASPIRLARPLRRSNRHH
jgi:O-antigen/teichoic acid export membrane protein